MMQVCHTLARFVGGKGGNLWNNWEKRGGCEGVLRAFGQGMGRKWGEIRAKSPPRKPLSAPKPPRKTKGQARACPLP